MRNGYLRVHWDTRVTKTAKRIAGAAGVDYRTFKAAQEAFEDLRYELSPVRRHDVQPIACTNGRLLRQRSSKPLYLLHYRSILAVVRQRRNDGKRGTLLLVGVLPRDPHTYDPARLEEIVRMVIEEAREEEKARA